MKRVTLLAATLLLMGASEPLEFDQYDTNGDQFLARSEVKQPGVFDRIDTSGDDLVSRHEFDSYLKPLPAPTAVDKVVHTNIPYYTKAEMETLGIDDPERVTLDIYQPKKGENLPVVLFVHGGSWQRGDKAYVGYKPDYFLASGFVFASTNYRFRPHVEIETLQQDVAAATAWIVRNIADYGGDPDNVFLIGHSAGAHQVSIVGTRSDLLEAHELDLSRLAGVVELDTMALDTVLMMETGERFYGPIFGTDTAKLMEVSPWHHIEKGRNTPPFMFIVADGNERKLVQSRRMAEKLEAAGAPALVVEAPNRTHGTLNRSLGGIGDEYGPQLLAFLRRHLR